MSRVSRVAASQDCKSIVFGIPAETESSVLDHDGTLETVETFGEHEDNVGMEQGNKGTVAVEVTVSTSPGIEMDENMDFSPLDKSAPKAMPTLQIIHRLFSTSPTDPCVTSSVPQRPMANVHFLVNVPSLAHWKTLLADGLGTWKASKGPTNVFVRKDTDANGGPVATAIDQVDYGREPNTYYFQRRAYVNASCPQYHRSVVTSADQRCELAFIQYYFRDAVEHEFEITIMTKNRLGRRSYSKATEIAGINARKRKAADVSRAVGDAKVSRFDAPAESQPEPNGVSVAPVKVAALPEFILEVMNKCNQEHKTTDTFIMEVVGAPEFSAFLANKRQQNDVRRFCTNPTDFSILCIDTLPNAGDCGLAVTFTAYEHLMVRGKDGRHPYMLGPMFLHQNVDFNSSYKLASALVHYQPSVRHLVAFGPSSDLELDRAFHLVFPNAKRFITQSELRIMVDEKLEELEIKTDVAAQIRQGIFGLLTDTEALGDYEVFQLLDTWQSLHQNGTEFGQYFLNTIALQIRQNYELRQKSGGTTPDIYVQQVCSQIKIMIKKACSKKCTVTELIGKLREIVWRQEKEVEGAVVGRADLKLVPAYAKLFCSESDFFSSTKTPMTQRRVILNQIHEEQLA